MRALSCAEAADAARQTYGTIGAVKDVTAALNGGGGTQFLTACQLSIPGQQLPLVIEFRAESRQHYDAEVVAAGKLGGDPKPIAGSGFGDDAYLIKEWHAPGYSVQAFLGGIHVSVTAPLAAQQVKNIAQAVIARL